MRHLIKRLAHFTPALALAAGGAAGATSAPGDRALALNVTDNGDRVEIQLIANSSITQQVEYVLELVGNSSARHSGSTNVAAGDRHVLSRLTTNVSDTWCATVEVTEANGESYTLTAGACTTS